MTPEDAEARRWDLALRMLDAAQGNIARLDETSQRIKGWCITVWAALVGFGLQQESALLLGVAAVAVVLFWSLDVQYKFFHEQFLSISANVERVLAAGRAESDDVPRLQIDRQLTGALFVGGRPHPRLVRVFTRPWFHFPYVTLLALSVLGILA